MGRKDGQRISFTLTTTSDEITGQTYLQAKVLGRPLSVIGLFRTKLSNYEEILIEHYNSKSKYEKDWIDKIVNKLSISNILKTETKKMKHKNIRYDIVDAIGSKQGDEFYTMVSSYSLLDCYTVIERARSQFTNYGNT